VLCQINIVDSYKITQSLENTGYLVRAGISDVYQLVKSKLSVLWVGHEWFHKLHTVAQRFDRGVSNFS
jgi:hypothetical protein